MLQTAGRSHIDLGCFVGKSTVPLKYRPSATDLSLAVAISAVFGSNTLTQYRLSWFAPNVMLMTGATSIGTKETV